MYEAIIVITCHKKDPITLYHINRFKEFHKDIPVIPVFEQDYPRLSYWNYDDMWKYCDNVFYRWFLGKDKIISERYFLFDYDTFCNDHIKNFYYKVWDHPVACSKHFSYYQNSKWIWFKEYKDTLKEYRDKLYGIIPYSGMMIKYDAVSKLINEQINHSIWKNIISELRIGTILNMYNIPISCFDKDKTHFISSNSRNLPNNWLNEQGIFHPVK
jgi:hypothetical protein